jgi:hypothetical protein
VTSDSAHDLHMLNVVVGNMSASLDFYRRLGVAVPDGDIAADAYVQLRMPGGFSLELDTAADPDGNDAGLMSPPAESRRTWPPQPSPSP